MNPAAPGALAALAAPAPSASPLPAHRDTAVRVEGVSKRYGRGGRGLLALDGLTFAVGRGELVCLLGASGCGKSTVLSLIARLEQPTSGTVEVPGGDTALMFQEAALFPWLTAEQNIALPLRLQGMARRERAAFVHHLLELVRLERFAHHRPHQLSGGMRQRVALARALAQRSDVLLMDEPFGSVDAITRDQLHEDLSRIRAENGISIVFVTHSVREAVRLGDRILLLSSRPGRIIDEYRAREHGLRTGAALAEHVTGRLREEIGRHARG